MGETEAKMNGRLMDRVVLLLGWYRYINKWIQYMYVGMWQTNPICILKKGRDRRLLKLL